MNSQQIDFLEKEFNVTQETLARLSRDEIGDLYERIADIEVEETMKYMDSDLSERGKTAVSLVDYLYKTYIH